MILRLFSEVAFLVGLQQNGDVYTFDTLKILWNYVSVIELPLEKSRRLNRHLLPVSASLLLCTSHE